VAHHRAEVRQRRFPLPPIRTRLGITVATVEVHRPNIMRKLGLHSVAALTKCAVRERLTSL
jgi:two-component system NarL family response regulator